MRHVNVRYDALDMPVSIHASVKDATRTAAILNNRRFVSIHASVKDATLKVDADRNSLWVSIHASVKDATIANGTVQYYVDVSIHASVKDATIFRNISRSTGICFNPRIRKGCDF